LRIFIGIILSSLISVSAAAADLGSTPQAGDASIVEGRHLVRRIDVARRTSYCVPCRRLPWGGLHKVRRAHVPFGGLRPVYAIGLPWGGLVETCLPSRINRRVVLVRKG
jgi:hypothetical protein